MRGNRDFQLIEELLLVGRGLGDSPQANLATVSRRQDDVSALQRGELGQGVCRRQAGAAAVQQMFHRDPERVAEKRDEDMRLHGG